MSTTWRTILGVTVLALSSGVPAAMLPLSNAVEPWVLGVVLALNAVAYSAFLAVHANTGRNRRAVYTALGSTIIPLLLVLLFRLDVLTAVIAWPCAYVVAWSQARRHYIGTFGIVAAVVVTFFGYIVVAYFVLVSAFDETPPAEASTGAAVLAALTAVAANGIIRENEHSHDQGRES